MCVSVVCGSSPRQQHQHAPWFALSSSRRQHKSGAAGLGLLPRDAHEAQRRALDGVTAFCVPRLAVKDTYAYPDW